MKSFRLAPQIESEHPWLKHYSPLVAQLLVNRNISDADTFLHPKYEEAHDPFLLHGMETGIERFYQAITNNEKITIYADYDADGIPGAVILHTLLEKIGYSNHNVYLPHRHDEGYGIHIDALEKIKDSGTDLVVTIDVGITAHEAALWSVENKLDMIITDHHLPLEDKDGMQQLPQSFALINPKQEECSYPDPMLCGCGVIFKFIQAFIQEHGEEFAIHEGWEKWLLDMVGIATISDMVPLRDENRILAYYGMKVLRKTKRKGLQKLMWEGGLNTQYMTEEDIAFGITPKINAASRMSHPEDAFALFIAHNESESETAMRHLVALNKERKKLVASTMKKVYAKLDKRDHKGVIVVGAPDWQAGILGLVASKIVDKYKVPAFVWSEENGTIKGSCRTYNGTHLVDLMSTCEDGSFIQFGGHKEAGGFSCEKSEIHFLQERLEQALARYEQTHTQSEEETVAIDMKLSLDDVTKDLYQDIQQLAPFGVANPKPLFVFEKVTPTEIKQFGKTKEHLEIHFKNNVGTTIRAITFFATPEDFSTPPEIGKALDLLAHIEYSVFMGRHELRLKIVDFLKK